MSYDAHDRPTRAEALAVAAAALGERSPLRKEERMPMTPAANPGLDKVLEECGELIQVLAKLSAYPNGDHPSRDYAQAAGRHSLLEHLVEELGDVYAALDFFCQHNMVKREMFALDVRRKAKYELFEKWHKEP